VCKFFGESLKENFGLSRKQHEREKSFQSSPIFITFEQRANFEEEDKREENARKKRTRAQAPPR
jgi:hypothetical protein